MANLINLERVSKSYGVRPLLDDVSLGISVGERVGIVGRNGDGKTTLLEVMTGIEQPDSGRVSKTRGVEIGYLHRATSSSTPTRCARRSSAVARTTSGPPTPRPARWWRSCSRASSLDRRGRRPVRWRAPALSPSRRCCSRDHDLIILDEPTNHLDVEAVAWLADHLVGSLPAR